MPRHPAHGRLRGRTLFWRGALPNSIRRKPLYFSQRSGPATEHSLAQALLLRTM
jgi:hypothetical protein